MELERSALRLPLEAHVKAHGEFADFAAILCIHRDRSVYNTLRSLIIPAVCSFACRAAPPELYVCVRNNLVPTLVHHVEPHGRGVPEVLEQTRPAAADRVEHGAR
jgi:hypothetical protein